VRRWLPAALAAAAVLTAAAPAHATLAYVKGILQGHPVLWTAADDGSAAHALVTGGFYPKVSPDGTQVAYVTGSEKASLKVRPVAGGPARTLAANVWNYDMTQWSPDGTTVSVVTGPELGPYTLKLVTAADGTARTLAKGFFAGLSFAPDGGGVVFARALTSGYPVRANLYTAPVAAAAPLTRITSDRNAASPAWGPERIAFSRARKPPRRNDYDKLDIYTIAPDGSGLQRLTTTKPPFLLAGLSPIAWSADGTRLAAQYGGQDTSEAWRVDAATGKAVDATGTFDGVVGWGLSRDGTTLLATTGSFDSPNGNVVAVDWDGGGQTVLARRATQPSWSR
jgi:Tol biopolymer transport system component